MKEQLTYVYAVLRASPARGPAVPDALRGVTGAPVALVRSDPLAAAVSTVPGEEFSESALRERLEDLAWLEATARAHHLVIETLAAHTTVLPLRLATVYLDGLRVQQMLREGRERFLVLLDRLTGHVEWGVKVYADVPGVPAATAPADDIGEPDPGRAYLRRRRYERQTRQDTLRSAEKAVRRTAELARPLAVERVRHRPQQGALAPATGENVANDAYLVPRRLGEEFRDRMLHAADEFPGVRVEVTGPWAPYSFATWQKGAGER
ncbi:GvpL/GvpF family gas vesicle protein [Streptomyces sp. enrichment culture]|uniref:GvpL/GvpF family gas vesicle protein n=1 Tax=Streptomyces sp. enrichment culture TaxID=1795815 RepID=UPI003F548F91